MIIYSKAEKLQAVRWISHEHTSLSMVRHTSYGELSDAFGTSGCSPMFPWWTAQASGVLETERGKQFVFPFDWLVTDTVGGISVYNERDFEALFRLDAVDVPCYVLPELRSLPNRFDPWVGNSVLQVLKHKNKRHVILTRSDLGALCAKRALEAEGLNVFFPMFAEGQTFRTKQFSGFAEADSGVLLVQDWMLSELPLFGDPEIRVDTTHQIPVKGFYLLQRLLSSTESVIC